MTLDSIYETALYQHSLWQQIASETNVNSKEDAETYSKGRIDSFRLSLEPHIYHYLIEQYGPKLDKFWQTYTPPKQAKQAFVLVERRPHQNFWFILRNMAWANPNMSVYIFCSDENISFVKALLGNKLPHFNVVEAFKGNASRTRGKKETDNLLSNYKVYDFIDAEYIMTVEMDTFIRRKIPDSMFQGDYWGNTWGWVPHTPGGGGITIRNVKKVSAHCKKHKPDITTDLHTAQDAWLSDTMYADKADFPDVNFRANHIMENVPVENPVAVHQFWTYLDSFQITNKALFMKYLTKILKLEIG
jgi:hypothetical protein